MIRQTIGVVILTAGLLVSTMSYVPEVWAKDTEQTEEFESYPLPVGGIAALSKAIEIPEGALQECEQAKVLLSVTVSETGEITAVEVIESATKKLDDAAIQGVRKAKWNPAMKDGRPTACQIMVPIQMKMGKK